MSDDLGIYNVPATLTDLENTKVMLCFLHIHVVYNPLLMQREIGIL